MINQRVVHVYNYITKLMQIHEISFSDHSKIKKMWQKPDLTIRRALVVTQFYGRFSIES